MAAKFKVGDRVWLTEQGVRHVKGSGIMLVSGAAAVVVGAIGTVTYEPSGGETVFIRVKFDADIRYKPTHDDSPMYDGSHFPFNGDGEIEPAAITP